MNSNNLDHTRIGEPVLFLQQIYTCVQNIFTSQRLTSMNLDTRTCSQRIFWKNSFQSLTFKHKLEVSCMEFHRHRIHRLKKFDALSWYHKQVIKTLWHSHLHSQIVFILKTLNHLDGYTHNQKVTSNYLLSFYLILNIL